MIKIKKLFKSNDIIYPSVDVLLSTSVDECNREKERTAILDNKCGVFITIIGAIITISMPLIPFSKFVSFYKNSGKVEVVWATVALCILSVSVAFFAKSFYHLYKAFSLKSFLSVNIEHLNNDKMLKQSDNVSKRKLVNHYNQILERNIPINDAKANNLAIGFKYGILAFVLFFISVVALIIIMGE